MIALMCAAVVVAVPDADAARQVTSKHIKNRTIKLVDLSPKLCHH